MDFEKELRVVYNEYKQGNKDKARITLRNFIKANPNDERGWWIYAKISENLDQRIFCLEKVIEINTDYKNAVEQLAVEKGKIKRKSSSYQEPKSKSKKIRTKPSPILISAIILFIMVLVLAYIVYADYIQSLNTDETSQVLEEQVENLTLQETSNSESTFPATWTPAPIISPTLRNSITPIFTETPFIPSITLESPTATITSTAQITILPTLFVPTITPSHIVIQPTSTEFIIPTETPRVTSTCGVIPSIIPGATNTPLTFWVQFSEDIRGLGIASIEFNPEFGGGQRGCSGVSDANGYATCSGSSGMLTYNKTVKVTINTSVDTCYTEYSSR